MTAGEEGRSMDRHAARELASVYDDAVTDPEFKADNEAIERDFAALDLEAVLFARPDG